MLGALGGGRRAGREGGNLRLTFLPGVGEGGRTWEVPPREDWKLDWFGAVDYFHTPSKPPHLLPYELYLYTCAVAQQIMTGIVRSQLTVRIHRSRWQNKPLGETRSHLMAQHRGSGAMFGMGRAKPCEGGTGLERRVAKSDDAVAKVRNCLLTSVSP